MSVNVVMLRTGEELDAAAELLWSVWEARDRAQRCEVISVATLRTLAYCGNPVTGAYRDGQLIGCSVAMFGAKHGRVDHLHSHLTGVVAPERARGIGYLLKRHQRKWALENGIDLITWTYDPLVVRNARFNLCKLGGMAVTYEPDFYGHLNDGANTNDQTDRLLVEWDLRAEWVERETPRYAQVTPDAELIAVPEDIRTMRETNPAKAQRERSEMRSRFRQLLTTGYRIAGLSKANEYVLVPNRTIPSYES